MLEQELHHQYLSQKQTPHIGEITLFASSLIKEILIHAFSHFPRRITSTVISIMVAQYRMTPLSGKRHYREKLFRHKDFELALKFLKLRAMVDEKLVDIYTSIRTQYRQIIRNTDHKHHSLRLNGACIILNGSISMPLHRLPAPFLASRSFYLFSGT